MAIYDEPGRGRKLCKSCGKYNGVRTHICENCKAPFPAKGDSPEPQEIKAVTPKPKVVKVETAPTVVQMHESASVIAPAGPCPIKLEGITPDLVMDWKQKVSAAIPKNLSTDALVYYARQFYDMRSDEYKEVVRILRTGEQHVGI